MKMQEIKSGSSGNCSYLFFKPENNLIIFDLGISFRELNNYLIEHEDLDLKNNTETTVTVLITHGHLDHWNSTTYKQLDKNLRYLDRIYPSVNGAVYSFHHEIEYFLFHHGNTRTRFYVVDEAFGYLTDISPDEILNVVSHPELHDLAELFIEANYDEYYKKVINQASIANAYDVNSGFSRHLSKTESAFVVASLNPKEVNLIHKSSRFYEVKND